MYRYVNMIFMLFTPPFTKCIPQNDMFYLFHRFLSFHTFTVTFNVRMLMLADQTAKPPHIRTFGTISFNSTMEPEFHLVLICTPLFLFAVQID